MGMIRWEPDPHDALSQRIDEAFADAGICPVCCGLLDDPKYGLCEECGDIDEEDREVTVPLIPKADRALDAIADRENVSRTDALNRALQIYDTLTEAVAAGDRVYLRHGDDTEQEVTWS